LEYRVKDGEKPKGHPINEFVEDYYFKGKKETVPIVGLVFGTKVALVINTPELSQELYLTKNKYFDKHPHASGLYSRMLGDSILFAKSDVLWQQKRKALSAALYKDKLRVMMEIMKDKTISIIRNKWMKAKNGEINIVSEASNLFINITISCLFGPGYEGI
jgi:cytochrome P450